MMDETGLVAVGPGRDPSEPPRDASGEVAADQPTQARVPDRETPSGAEWRAGPGGGTETRLAHLHLRTGMFALARAELETLAALGALDLGALADLAEVRWRTGDLVGAAEAADAHLQAGGEELVAMCVAAEAAAAAGRTADARDLAARVLARGRDQLDQLFAGQPRSGVWPPEPQASEIPALPMAAPVGGSESLARRGSALATAAWGDLAEIHARIARGDLAGTGTRLALVLRDRPALAPAVLAIADDVLARVASGPEVASLHLARGDAYRLMGRETQAADAFWQSSKALHGAATPEETP